MELLRERLLDDQGLLYPMMVIAAIALIVFSLLGIASVTGSMPSALSGSYQSPRDGAAFECSECGVIESVRELERSMPTPGAMRAENSAPGV